MSTEHHSTHAEEIDLGYFFKQISNFFRGIVRSLFLIFDFFKRYIIWVILLIIVGVVLGYFADKNTATMYQNKLLVVPNFESTDYLYDKVEEINLKRKQRDSVFIKQFTGENWQRFSSIEIEALPDIYNFVTKSREQLDAFRILFENQELSEFLEDNTTSRSFKYHRMNFYVGGESAPEVVDKIIDYLNENEFYKGYQKVYQKNTALSIDKATNMAENIESIMVALGRVPEEKNGVLSLTANSNSDMYELSEYQQLLLQNKLELEKKQYDQDKVIKVVSANYKVVDKGIFGFSKKVKFPIYFVFLFSFVFFVIYLFRTLRAFTQETNDEQIDNA